MTTSFNPSVGNNTSFPTTRLMQEQPKFGLAPEPAVDAPQPQATVSKFAGLVPSNANVETKKFDTAALASAFVQERPVAPETAQAAPETSAATGDNLVDPNWHSYFPQPVGNAFNPNPQPSAPFHGFPHEFSNRAVVGVHEMVDVTVAKNHYNPHFIPAGVIGHTLGVKQNEANAITRLASGDRNLNPVASAGQFYNLFASRGTHQTPAEMQRNTLQLADTGNWNQHYNPNVNGMDMNGFRNSMSDRGTPHLATWGNYSAAARMDPFSDPGVINVSDMQRMGVPIAANGDFPLSVFGGAIDRLASVPSWQRHPPHQPRPVTPTTSWRPW